MLTLFFTHERRTAERHSRTITGQSEAQKSTILNVFQHIPVQGCTHHDRETLMKIKHVFDLYYTDTKYHAPHVTERYHLDLGNARSKIAEYHNILMPPDLTIHVCVWGRQPYLISADRSTRGTQAVCTSILAGIGSETSVILPQSGSGVPQRGGQNYPK